MIHPKTFEFLKGLEEFNDKRFFELYKDLYKEIHKSIVVFADHIIKWISEFDVWIEWTLPKKCLFRIHRDTRFSKNKTPYKINFWISVAPGWKNSIYWCYYVHIQPGKSFFGGGIFMPSTENAYKIRQYLYNHEKEFFAIIWDKKFKKEFWDLYTYQPALKKFPKILEDKWSKINKYIQYKDWLVDDVFFSDEEVLSADFGDKIIKLSKIIYPINEFLNKSFK